MSQAAPETVQSPPAPIAPQVTRGLFEGTLSTRAAAPGAGTGAGISSSYDPETRTFEFVAASGKPVKSERYFKADGDEYPRWQHVEEQLDMNGAVELDNLIGASILDSHYYYAVGAIVGVIESARLDGGKLVCVGRLSQREGVADIARDIQDGIIRSVSVGFDIVEQSIATRAGQIPLVTIKRWKPREASLVGVPADASARIRSGAPSTMSEKVEIVADAPSAEELAQDAAAVDAARSALAAAEAKLAARTAKPTPKAPATPGAPAAPGVERKAQVDALRSIAQRKGADVLRDFDDLATGGGTVDELRVIAVSAIATSGGEISGVTSARNSAPPARKGSLLTRSAYVAHRAAGGGNA